ncbi:MAG: hypothetical protein NPIRA06_12120 [Nitrospirales bacterium]|nr:MAG: hypothetical protein NPIRA06_12120 [Nitrospirales bacterium]
MDRFLMHVYIDYPDEASEIEVIRLVRGEERPQPAVSEMKASSAEAAPISQEVVFAARDEIYQSLSRQRKRLLSSAPIQRTQTMLQPLNPSPGVSG